ncbi:MAG: ABC transporter ATP-binding protein [Bacteroidota bacterium]
MKKLLLVNIISRVYRLLSPKQRRRGLLSLAGIFISAFFEVIGLAMILPVVTVALKPEILETSQTLKAVYEAGGFEDADQFLLALILIMLGIFLFKNILGLTIIYVQAAFATGVATDLSRQKYDYYDWKGFQTIKNIDSGDYITNVRNIPTFFGQSLLIPLMNLISEIMVITIILVTITIYDTKLILALGIFVGLGFVIVYRLTKNRAHRVGVEKKVVAPQILKYIQESLSGFVDIFIFQSQDYFKKRFLDLKDREDGLVRQVAFLNMVPSKLNEVIAVSGVVFIFLYSMFLSDNREGLLTMLSLFAVAAYRVMPSMNRILMYIVNIKGHVYTLDFLDRVHEMPEEENLPDPQPISFEKELYFEGVTYQFEDAETPIIDAIELEIKKGELLGVIGKSGSGKTTLIRLLLRLYREQKGQILIDGKKLDLSTEKAWIDKLGFVQQQVFILDGTLAENIAFGTDLQELEEKKVKEVIEMSGLGDFLNEQPEGIHTPVGEGGSKLSGGQRQRLAIARALYKDAEVIIFDEATSALDPKTEQIIIQAVDQLSKLGKTVILIAHRFSTLRSCHRIVELKKGKLHASYTYEELMQLEKDWIAAAKTPV